MQKARIGILAAGFALFSTIAPVQGQTPAHAHPAETPPTSEEVTAYLLKDGPPQPERIFRGLSIKDREGLRFDGFGEVECTEKTRWRGKPYWRCSYTRTAVTTSGTRLTSRSWEFLGRGDHGGLEPIKVELVPTPLASSRPLPSANPHPPIPLGSGGGVSVEYPAVALRNGWKGLVHFVLSIDEKGIITACKIAKTSGFEILDKAACRNARQLFSFRPATDGQGNAIPGTYEGHQNFNGLAPE